MKKIEIMPLIAIILIIGVVCVLIFGKTEVKADDIATMEYVNQEVAKLQTQIEDLKTENETLKLTVQENTEDINTLTKTTKDIKANLLIVKNTANNANNAFKYFLDKANANTIYNYGKMMRLTLDEYYN